MANLTPTCPACKCLSDVILKARDGDMVCLNCANAQLVSKPKDSQIYDMPTVEEVVAAGYPASHHEKILEEREAILKELNESAAPQIITEPEPLPPIETPLPVDTEPETPWCEPVSEPPAVALEDSFIAPQPNTKSEKLSKKFDKKKSQ